MEISEINEMFGKSFKLGDEVFVNRGPSKSPHIGMIVGTKDHWLRLKLDGEDRIYPAVFEPRSCYVIQSS